MMVFHVSCTYKKHEYAANVHGPNVIFGNRRSMLDKNKFGIILHERFLFYVH